MPTGLYILPSVISSFFNLRQIISGFTGPIFTIFSPNKRYLREYSRSGPLFFIPLGTLRWQPIFGKICKVTFIQHAGISQWIRRSQFCLRGDKGHNLFYISCNFGDDRCQNTTRHRIINIFFLFYSKFADSVAQLHVCHAWLPVNICSPVRQQAGPPGDTPCHVISV